MVVARVDGCAQSIKAILAPRPGTDLERAVEYKKNIIESEDGRKVFRPEILDKGLSVLSEFKAIALAHGAQKFSAVATSAFRDVSASYSEELLALIQSRLGIPVRVIDQSEEARLGFLAAVVKLEMQPSELLVWDIGGGSLQISFWDEASRQVLAYEGDFANNTMEAFVIEELKGLPRGTHTSPNPILSPQQKQDPENHVYAAIHKAEEIASTTVSAEHRTRIAQIPVVVGIGGVHYYSNCEITHQSPGCQVTRQRLQADILDHAHLNDAELVATGRAGSIEYAPKRITAGALTVGFMNALGIDRVRSAKIDMADGILISSEYWLSKD
jgi:exopolyphosphatase/guanosine-5'-triphosphate,3'-diphosphate pyrophosphatase